VSRRAWRPGPSGSWAVVILGPPALVGGIRRGGAGVVPTLVAPVVRVTGGVARRQGARRAPDERAHSGILIGGGGGGLSRVGQVSCARVDGNGGGQARFGALVADGGDCGERVGGGGLPHLPSARLFRRTSEIDAAVVPSGTPQTVRALPVHQAVGREPRPPSTESSFAAAVELNPCDDGGRRYRHLFHPTPARARSTEAR
jgi:hypothetical protein